MSYIPDSGTAVVLNLGGPYAPPLGSAVPLPPMDAATGDLLGVGLLGAPALTGTVTPVVMLVTPGLLGAATMAASRRPQAHLAWVGLIGGPVLQVAASGTAAHLRGDGLLGVPQAQTWYGATARLVGAGVMGAPRSRVDPRPFASLRGPGILGAPRQTAFIYPPAAAVLPAGVTTYHCRLTGAPDGLADVTLPMSSFSVRHRYDGPSYYQLTIPTYAYVADIAARPNGEIVIWSKTGDIEEELLRGDLGSVRTDRGPKSQSISISGNSERAASDPETYLLAEALYASTTFEGESRLRIPPRAAIRPGDFIRYADLNFQAGDVTWSVAVSAGGMAITMEIASLPVDA